ncbi:MAG: glycerophosphodiester phosphodiesterase, partial [Sediminibacterium sp.]|nr:glycerophosphodiester phosphodiesterase [Sediminibacterium sp.]
KKIFAACCVIALAACFSTRQTTTLEVKHFDTQGHRGCRGLMPENTIPAMLKAIDLGVTTLETDAVITRDHQVVLSHEPFFNHEISTKPNGMPVTEAEEKSLNIFRMDYDEIRKFDVGLRPHPRFPAQQKLAVAKPLLGDMIDSVEQYCTRRKKPLPQYNIETKSQPSTDGIYHPGPGEFVEILVALITRKKIAARVIIQSFDPRTLQYVHEHYPALKTALLIEDFNKKIFALQLNDLGFIPSVYSPHFSLVTPLLVKQCHDAGISLVPWTVNDLAKMRELKKMGVNGLISDFPDLLAQL